MNLNDVLIKTIEHDGATSANLVALETLRYCTIAFAARTPGLLGVAVPTARGHAMISDLYLNRKSVETGAD